MREAVANVNICLSKDSPINTFKALQKIKIHLSPLLEFAAPLYHNEMASIRLDAKVCNLYFFIIILL